MSAPGPLSCREAAKLLSQAAERALVEEELEALQFHLGRCGACRNFETQLRFLKDAARRFATGPTGKP